MMRTFNAPMPLKRFFRLPHRYLSDLSIVPVLAASCYEILALLGAVTIATAMVMLTVWLAATDLNHIQGAATWATGFIFLGLAIDNPEPKALLQLVSGLALLVLSWLQAFVSADFIIIAGLIVSLWVAWAALGLFNGILSAQRTDD